MARLRSFYLSWDKRWGEALLPINMARSAAEPLGDLSWLSLAGPAFLWGDRVPGILPPPLDHSD